MADPAASSLIRPPEHPTLPLDRLAPEAALRRLELTVVRRLEGHLQGDHLGVVAGPGSDPNDARPYQPGEDDVRKIDWPVTARTRVTHVRDTISDRELEVWGLIDMTPSMNWGTTGITKRDLGIAALATFGFLSQRMGDRFGGMVMRPDGVRRLPARSGRMALYALLRSLLQEPIVPDSTDPGIPLSPWTSSDGPNTAEGCGSWCRTSSPPATPSWTPQCRRSGSVRCGVCRCATR